MAKARKAALITGAGRNIGRACVLGLAEDGFNVILNGSSDRAACESVAKEALKFGVETLVIMGDVGKPEDCKHIADDAIKHFGAVDVLVNNAALRPNKPFLEMSEAEWRRIISVDLDAAVWLSRACLPGMLDKGWGRIVNFTGMNAMHGYAGRAPVSVAKHGIWGLTQVTALEGRPFGISCGCLHPGNTRVERRLGSTKVEDEEPMMTVAELVQAAVLMAALPAHVNMLEAIVLPVGQEYVGRG